MRSTNSTRNASAAFSAASAREESSALTSSLLESPWKTDAWGVQSPCNTGAWVVRILFRGLGFRVRFSGASAREESSARTSSRFESPWKTRGGLSLGSWGLKWYTCFEFRVSGCGSRPRLLARSVQHGRPRASNPPWRRETGGYGAFRASGWEFVEGRGSGFGARLLHSRPRLHSRRVLHGRPRAWNPSGGEARGGLRLGGWGLTGKRVSGYEFRGAGSGFRVVSFRVQGLG